VDYTGDVLIGPGIIRQMSDTYRKFRGTLRYLLGNLSDFDVSCFIWKPCPGNLSDFDARFYLI
jgi:isoleucyl-tRNA synthetase